MKAKNSIILILFLMSFSITSKAQSDGPVRWLASGEYSLVWAYTGITSIERVGCCVDSDPDNACDMSYESDNQTCKSGRALGFAAEFESSVKSEK